MITLQTNSMTQTGVYTVCVNAYLQSYYPSYYLWDCFYITITWPPICYTDNYLLESKISNIVYYIGEPMITIDFYWFVFYPVYCGIVSSSYQSLNSPQPEGLSF